MRALQDAAAEPLWLDDTSRPEPLPPLRGPERADLVVVGGGYAGLWSALRAKERDPGRDVVLVEARTCGWAASGRNGGFCSASLTHGRANGARRWPGEIGLLDRLGRENLDAIEAAVGRYGIDAGWERNGEIDVATAPWQVDELRSGFDPGSGAVWLERDHLQAEVHSPTYLAGVYDPDGVALVHPAKLAWGLRRACLEAGVRIYERTAATALADWGVHTSAAPGVHTSAAPGVHASAAPGMEASAGRVEAAATVLATNAFPSLLRRVRPYLVPVYDYALATEPLNAAQRESIGWKRRQGLADAGNQFHYYRLTADDRIVWGGYDAVYHPGGRIKPEYDLDDSTHAALAAQFFDTFPQLEGLRFTHRWGGVVDTCTRFCAFFGTARKGRVAYAAGFTGLGVGATRFAADVMLDLLSGEATERTELEMVRRRPLPFPPEPLATPAIQLTRWSMARADRHGGRRNLWLRALDAIGAGFDS